MTAPDLLFASDIAVPEVWLQLPDGTRVRYVREDAGTVDYGQPFVQKWHTNGRGEVLATWCERTTEGA